MKKLIKILLLAIMPAAVSGQNNVLPTETEGRTVLNSFMLEGGSAHRADTYLTPLHYDGWVIRPAYSHINAAKRHPFLWMLDVAFSLDRTLSNPARNSSMLGAQFEARWAIAARWRVAKMLEIGAGGGTTLDAGALYVSRNGNNPVAANASWTVDAAAYATAAFRIGRLPAVAMYRATLPFAGAMFAPDYGQLYYEIYLGDTRSLFTGAWWGKYFRLDQSVTLDLKVGPKWLRVGYGCDITSTKVNDIVSRRIDHTFILGLTTDWFSFKH